VSPGRYCWVAAFIENMLPRLIWPFHVCAK
jgi:hypothetical protein